MAPLAPTGRNIWFGRDPHGDEAAVVRQHHVPTEALLSRVQLLTPTWVKPTDTPLNDTSPCDLFISCGPWKPDENCTGPAARPRGVALAPEGHRDAAAPGKDNFQLRAE